MCAGGLDPKYGLRELEQSFKSARQSAVIIEKNRETKPGLIGWALARIARFQGKEVTHG